MDKINWSNYNYDEFEMFCNALLTFEFGKNYMPFSAAGRDGGIDGAFTGAYQDLSGRWRFQFKFSQVARGEAVNNLRYQLKKEVEKLGEEEYFVLLTNIELLPQEHAGLLAIFETEKQALNKKAAGFIWDGAKIFNLFLQYPILFLWINDGFSTAQVQDYKIVFSKSLNAGPFEPSSLSNFFISREEDINKLNDFITSDENLMVVSGEAGIGKTRLVIEFFKQTVDLLEQWMPLVLMNKNIDFDKLRKAFSANYNYVVLIDDAHNYRPEIISDLNALIENLPNRIKLILTSRTIGASDSLSLLKESLDISFINLNELSRQDTELIFKHYLENTELRHYTNELVMTSFGKPILIVAMLNAIFKGEPIHKIKEQDFLKLYVNRYFKTYIEEVSDITGINKLSITKLLQNIVLIEPINFTNGDVLRKLSELHDINISALTEALNILINNNFVNGRFEQSIKPDYYSDIILSQIKKTEIVNYLAEFSAYIENIIINLSSVAEIDNDHNNILNEILQVYINLIGTEKDIKKVQKILLTVRNISFAQPEVAKSAVIIFINSLVDYNHPIVTESNRNGFKYYSDESPVLTVISILSNLFQFSNNIEFVCASTFKLYDILPEGKIAGIYSFSKRDIIERFSMERQTYFVEMLSKGVKRFSEKDLEFSVLCCKSLLTLDYTHSEWDVVNKESIVFTTYYIPCTPKVKKFRKFVISTLIKFYKLQKINSLRSELLKFIIDIPRAIFATQRNSTPYKNDEEMKIIFEFLIKEGKEFDILDQKEILEKLYWFEKWGISEDLKPLISEVKNVLKPKNLTERLSQLFSKAELSILDMPNIEEYVVRKCGEIVKTATTEELAESIIEFLAPQNYPPHYYFTFQKELENNYPKYARQLHDKLFDHSYKLYGIYGARILSALYFKHNDKEFYWTQAGKLQKLNSTESDNALLSVYSDKVPGFYNLDEEDIEVIVKVFKKKNAENNYELSMALQSLFVVNYPEALKICADFLDRAAQRQTEMFFIRLSDNKTVSDEQMAYLVLKHTIRYQLSYEIEHCLNKILITAGPDPIFEYLLERFDFKKNIVITKKTFGGYEFVPYGSHSHLFNQTPHSLRDEMFFRALNWFMDLDSDAGHLYYAKDLLEYLQPAKSLSISLYENYDKIISKFRDDGEKLERIIMSLNIFHVKDDNLLQTIINCFNYATSFIEEDSETYQSLRDACYIAIITMGVKSGSANQPFKVDLDLQSLLKNCIASQPYEMPSTPFLKEVLKSVEADINRLTDKDNLTW